MAKLVLVVIGEHKRKVSFTGSSLEELIEAIENKFADCISSCCRNSHLQMFDKVFEEYVDLTDVSEIEDKSKLRAVRKEVKLVILNIAEHFVTLIIVDKRSSKLNLYLFQDVEEQGSPFLVRESSIENAYTSLYIFTGPILHGLVG